MDSTTNKSINNLAQTRREYTHSELSEANIAKNPLEHFSLWLEQAEREKILDHNAMTLSTTNAKGQPSARIVLLKKIDQNNLYFFTDYSSQKGKDLEINPRAALSFFWPALERQVLFEGRIEKLLPLENDQYFNERPIASRISAIVSHQSQIINSRDDITKEISKLTQETLTNPSLVVRPERWGGYQFLAEKVEFWQGRESRLHDRLLFIKEKNIWTIHRLSP